MNMSSTSKVYNELTWGGALSTNTTFFYRAKNIELDYSSMFFA